eukprot:scaffold1596_cov302-Pinguiococcus_pyrenoidosus.AAC.35
MRRAASAPLYPILSPRTGGRGRAGSLLKAISQRVPDGEEHVLQLPERADGQQDKDPRPQVLVHGMMQQAQSGHAARPLDAAQLLCARCARADAEGAMTHAEGGRRSWLRLSRFHRVAEGLVRGSERVAAEQRANRGEEQLDIRDRVVSLDLLVEVGVEGNVLDIRGLAHLNERLAGGVVGVEHLLEQVQNGVGGSVGLVVRLQVQILDLLLGGEARAAGHGGNDGLARHAARLGGEIDTLSAALGHVSGGVADKHGAALHAAGAVVLRDGVGLDLDDLASGDLGAGAVADGLLVLLDGRAVHDGASAHADVVILGEDPSVEVGADIVTHVHLSELLVERHLLIVDLDALLEGDGVVVLAGTDGLGDARVGTCRGQQEANQHGVVRHLL